MHISKIRRISLVILGFCIILPLNSALAITAPPTKPVTQISESVSLKKGVKKVAKKISKKSVKKPTKVVIKAKTYQVSIENFAFTPIELKIHIADSVTFTEKDSTPHTVTADSNQPLIAGFNSGTLAQGKSYTYIFKGPGTFTYHCNIHPSMKAKIIVEE